MAPGKISNIFKRLRDKFRQKESTCSSSITDPSSSPKLGVKPTSVRKAKIKPKVELEETTPNAPQSASELAPEKAQKSVEEPTSTEAAKGTNEVKPPVEEELSHEEELPCEKEPPQSLWDSAYDKFRNLSDENKELVKSYEDLIENAAKCDSNQSDEGQSSAECESRQEKLNRIIEEGLQKQAENEIKANIFGHEVSLSATASKLATFALGLKEFVGRAVNASPEASLAWAGVCLILPLLTIPETAKQANASGFTEVTFRMEYYIRLESFLLHYADARADTDPILTHFKNNIERLYQQVIEFQINCALRYHKHRSDRLWSDFFSSKDWAGMTNKIKDLENDLTKQLKTMTLQKMSNNLEGMRKDLGDLRIQAVQSYNGQREILEELGTIKDILWEISQNTKPPLSLPFLSRALYNSRANQVDSITSCSPRTRIRLLEHITAWANEPGGQTILWVNGPAGVGKSTIAHSIASVLDAHHQLAASYFFRRGDANRNEPSQLFGTISSQLVQTISGFRKELDKSLTTLGSSGADKDSIKDLTLEDQFRALIRTPLSNISKRESEFAASVIVIDALDECEGLTRQEDIPLICQLFSELREIETVRLYVFVTSQKETLIEMKLGLALTYIKSIDLQEAFSSETTENVSEYLSNAFESIRMTHKFEEAWPDQDIMIRLIELATKPYPLFIYASTLHRFVNDGKNYPKDQLLAWLENSNTESELGKTYQPILAPLVSGNEKTDLCLNQVLCGLVVVATSLPATALSYLLEIEGDKLKWMLQKLHAVLKVPKDPKLPVEIIHNSFRNYLLGKEIKKECGIIVNPSQTHKMVLSLCLERIRCQDGENASKLLSDDGLEYACCFWVFHLKGSETSVTKGDDTCKFLQCHIHKWLRSLSRMGRLPEG